MSRVRIASPALAFAWILALPVSGATDGVIIVCPASVNIGPTKAPAGWTVAMTGEQPFKGAGAAKGMLDCGYGRPNAENSYAGVITRPAPNGMTCTVNATNPRQFDCLPSTVPQKLAPGVAKQKVVVPR